MLIRPYEPKDRSFIRHICCETADNGSPVETLFADRELVADFWTVYYTDYEPGSIWVAEKDGIVVGYLTGCLNEKIFQRTMLFRLLPRLLTKHLLRRSFWTMFHLTYILTNIFMGFKTYTMKNAPEYHPQGHLHINFLTTARGEHAGRQLIEKFFAQARSAGIQGIRIGVREDNVLGRGFFEKMGFKQSGRRFAFHIPGKIPADYFSIIYDHVF